MMITQTNWYQIQITLQQQAKLYIMQLLQKVQLYWFHQQTYLNATLGNSAAIEIKLH